MSDQPPTALRIHWINGATEIRKFDLEGVAFPAWLSFAASIDPPWVCDTEGCMVNLALAYRICPA